MIIFLQNQCACVCVCMCVRKKKEREGGKDGKEDNIRNKHKNVTKRN